MLLKVINQAKERFKIRKPIIVADGGLLSQYNITKLVEAKHKFILEARVRNESDELKKEIISKLDEIRANGYAEFKKIIKGNEFRLIVSYSQERAKHDLYKRNKGVEKLRKKHSIGHLTKKDVCNRGYNKFLKLECDKIEVSIDEDKIKEYISWDGLKGHITNSKMSAKKIRKNYSHLWQIEKAFRISKTDLRIRPIYHRKKRRIKAHICIVFAAYAVFEELEMRLKKSHIDFSANEAIEYLKNIY